MSKNVVQFRPKEYTAKPFAVEIDGRIWDISGTLCGNIDVATGDRTYCITPDELRSFIFVLEQALADVSENARPDTDPRIMS